MMIHGLITEHVINPCLYLSRFVFVQIYETTQTKDSIEDDFWSCTNACGVGLQLRFN